MHSRGQGSTVVHGPRVGVGPELVVRHAWLWARAGCGSCLHGFRAAWLCIGPGLVLRVGLVVDGDRSGCAWCQGWLCMGSGLGCGVGLVVHGVRASM